MQKNSPAKQLDKILEFIVRSHALVLDEVLNEMFGELSKKEIAEIVGKLAIDKLVEIKKHTYEGTPYVSYHSTFEGRLFFETGGYVAKNERDKRHSFNHLLNSRIITFGAGLAAAYYLLAIIRIYIIPILQFACACKFVWQK